MISRTQKKSTPVYLPSGTQTWLDDRWKIHCRKMVEANRWIFQPWLLTPEATAESESSHLVTGS